MNPCGKQLCVIMLPPTLLVAMLLYWLGAPVVLTGGVSLLLGFGGGLLLWCVYYRPWKVSEARSRILFDSVVDAAVITNTQGRILAANPSFQRLFDKSEAELRNKPIGDWVDIDRAEQVPGRVLQLMNGHHQSRYMEVEQGPLMPDQGGRQRYVFIRDVTHRTEAERRRRMLRACVAQVEDMILIVEIPSDDTQPPRILFVNESVSRTMGYAPGELIGGDPEIFIGEQTDHKTLIQVRRATRQRQPWREVLLTYKANGDTLWCEWDVAPLVFQEDDEPIFIAVVRDITVHKRREETLQRLNALLNDVREAERARIARDLHDELGQILSAIKLDAASLKRSLTQDDSEHYTRLVSIGESASEAIRQVRSIAKQLRPSALDDLGFVSAARWFIEQSQRRLDIPHYWVGPEFDHDHLVNPTLATVLYRFLQEALTNVGRHAQAAWVKVHYEIREFEVELSIEDNGQGADPAMAESSGHLGLLGMRERVQSLGGTFQVRSAPGNGFRVTAILPATAVELTDPLRPDKLRPSKT